MIGVLILFVALSAAYNVSTPLFEGPDEAAHYQYIKYLADGHGLPTLEHSPYEVLWEGLQQPPLYYTLGALLTFWIDTSDLPDLLWANPHRGGETGGVNLYYHSDREAFPYRRTSLAVHLVRLLNTVFGLVTVAAAFLAARELFPRQPALALGGAAAVAFNPQFLFTSGVVSNDGLAAACCSLATWRLVRMLRQNEVTPRDGLWLGLVVALGAAAKASALAFMLPCWLGVALVARRRRSWSSLLWGWATTGVPVALLSGWWYVRNWLLYGDLFGRNAFVAIKAPIVRAEPLPLSEALYYSTWMQKSFWGVFGNGVLMDFSVYHALEIVMRLSALGLLVLLVRQFFRRSFDTATWLGLGTLVLWSGLVYAALIRFMQVIDATNQGRLLFPAIVALSLLFVLGLSGFFPKRLVVIPASVVSVALLALAVFALFQTLIPAYAQPPAGQHLTISAPAPGMPVRFADAIELLSYTVSPPEIKAGSVIHVSFAWRCLAPMQESYKLFVHVLGFDGVRLTQLDTVPYAGRFATVLWKPGQEFRDEYDLFITGKARPSLGKIQIGFFPWNDPGRRLPVSTSDGKPLGDHVELAPFKIGPKNLKRPEIPRPVEAQFGDAISLLGYSLPQSPVRAGESLSLTLSWEARAKIPADYTVFIHILNAKGETVAQQDVPPQGGNYPTSIWGPGEVVTDEHSVPLPARLAGGEYSVSLGLYLPQTGQRLPVKMGGQDLPDGRALIGPVKVEAALQ